MAIQKGNAYTPQILADLRVLLGSGGTPHYYLPTQIFRPCANPVHTMYILKYIKILINTTYIAGKMGLTYIRSFPYDYFKLCNLLSPHSTSKIHILNICLYKQQQYVFVNLTRLTDSYIIFTLKMESVSKNTIFGLKMMVKSGLE